MFCGAKLPFLFSFLSSLFTGKSRARGEEKSEERKVKGEKYKKKKPPLRLFLFGGAEGSRTPVRKPLDMTFFGCSSFFEISTRAASTNRLRRHVAFLCVISSKANGRCTFTAYLTPERGPRYSPAGRVARGQRQLL